MHLSGRKCTPREFGPSLPAIFRSNSDPCFGRLHAGFDRSPASRCDVPASESVSIRVLPWLNNWIVWSVLSAPHSELWDRPNWRRCCPKPRHWLVSRWRRRRTKSDDGIRHEQATPGVVGRRLPARRWRYLGGDRPSAARLSWRTDGPARTLHLGRFLMLWVADPAGERGLPAGGATFEERGN